jgi:hypothetical protein
MNESYLYSFHKEFTETGLTRASKEPLTAFDLAKGYHKTIHLKEGFDFRGQFHPMGGSMVS